MKIVKKRLCGKASTKPCGIKPTAKAGNSLDRLISEYKDEYRHGHKEDLAWFKKQATLREAIKRAAWATEAEEKRHPHQRRLTRWALNRAWGKLNSKLGAIRRAKGFHEIFTIVEEIAEPISGLGELYVYDTSLRIAAYRNIRPKKVYLHSGTRKGARAMGLKHKAETLPVKDLPVALHELRPDEIEDFLCIYKARLLQRHGSRSTP